MARAEHFLPQVYLREWCTGGKLSVYRCVGPTHRVHRDFVAPKQIAHEEGLYDLPSGGVANGLTDDKLEDLLADRVDAKIGGIRGRARAAVGLVPIELRDDLLWLMRTFVARAPSTIGRVEDGSEELIAEHAEMIERMMQRALAEESRTALLQLRDSRRPRVAARALVAAAVTNDLPADLDWLVGDVHVVQFAEVADELQAKGAREFVTFDDPVVYWSGCSFGLLASFVLSPATLVLLVEPGHSLTSAQGTDAAMQHTLRALDSRHMLITRSEATGDLFAAGARLAPFAARRTGSPRPHG